MNSTGIIRRIDDLGRVVVPRDMRKSFGLQEGTPLEVCATELGVDKTREIRLCISDLKEILKEADGRR